MTKVSKKKMWLVHWKIWYSLLPRVVSLCHTRDETRLDKKSHNEGKQNVTCAQRSSSSKMIRVKAFYLYSVHVCVFGFSKYREDIVEIKLVYRWNLHYPTSLASASAVCDTGCTCQTIANFAHSMHSFWVSAYVVFMSGSLFEVNCLCSEDQINHYLSGCCQILIWSAVSMCTEELNTLGTSALKFVEMQQFVLA